MTFIMRAIRWVDRKLQKRRYLRMAGKVTTLESMTHIRRKIDELDSTPF